jgi:hypothetical protein
MKLLPMLARDIDYSGRGGICRRLRGFDDRGYKDTCPKRRSKQGEICVRITLRFFSET